MTFPVLQSSVLGNSGATNANQFTIPIQAGSVGEIIVVIISCDGNPNFTIDQAFSGSNWVQSAKVNYFNTISSIIVWKYAEGSDQLKISTSLLEQLSWAVIRASGVHSFSANSVIRNTANGAPTNHSAYWGLDDQLWVVARCGDSSVVSTAAPPGYSGLQTLAGGVDGSSIDVAFKSERKTLENPGVFTHITEQGVYWTIALSPTWPGYIWVFTQSSFNALAAVLQVGSAVSVAAQSSMVALARTIKYRLVASSSSSILSVARSLINKFAIIDHNGNALLDHYGDSIDGSDSIASSDRTIQINTLSILAALRRIVRKSNVSIAATSSVAALARRIQNRAISIVGISTGIAISNISYSRQVEIFGQSTLDAGPVIAGVAGRTADMISISLMDASWVKTTDRAMAVASTSLMSASSVKTSTVQLLMSSAAFFQASYRLTTNSVAGFAMASMMNAIRRSTRKLSIAVSSASSVAAIRQVAKVRATSVIGHSSVAVLRKVPAKRSISIGAQGRLVASPQNRALSSRRRAKARDFQNSHILKEFR